MTGRGLWDDAHASPASADTPGALLRRLADRGASLIVVLHDVNLAARFCDELLALHSGRLVRRGPCAVLMNEEALEAIYDVPMAMLRHPVSGLPVSVPL